MNYTKINNTVYLGKKFVEAVTSKAWTHKVTLHHLPEYDFIVDATSIDNAQAIAFGFVQATKGGLISNAATVEAI